MLLVWAAVVAAAPAQLLLNASFESNYQAWSQPNANLGVGYAIATGGVDGVRYARITGRTMLADAPRQNVTASLAAGTNGEPYATRFSVRVAAPSSVRAWLQFTDQDGLRKLILAERMVLTTGVWTTVRGRQTVAWQGSPTNAVFYFEVGQMVEGVFPDFDLDGITVQPDTDGDGLADVDETTTSPTAADSDGDGLPDLWESDYGFTNGVNEASDDDDGDGFSNFEECWAATNPRDRWSFPGRSSNPNASSRARAVLDYLALLPCTTNQRVLVGQHCAYPTNEFTNFITRLQQQTGRWPALLSLQYDDNANPLQVSNANAYALNFWTNGGLVLIKWQPRNPWTMLAGGLDTNHAAVNLVALLDPTNGPPAAFATNLHAHTNFMAWLDEAADGLAALQTSGVIVLWRPMSEMNGGWDWHGHQGRDGWIAVWRFMHDYFTRERGLDNLLWVFEPDQSVHAGSPADYYYPGDDVVDVMGHNFYDDDWRLPFDLDGLFREHGKVYGFPQAGPGTIRDGSWSNATMMSAIHERYPRASFFCTWNSFTTNGTSYVHLAQADQSDPAGAIGDPWAVHREMVAWTNFLRPPEVDITTYSNRPALAWHGGHLEESTDLRAWTNPPTAAFPFTNVPTEPGFFRSRDL